MLFYIGAEAAVLEQVMRQAEARCSDGGVGAWCCSHATPRDTYTGIELPCDGVSLKIHKRTQAYLLGGMPAYGAGTCGPWSVAAASAHARQRRTTQWRWGCASGSANRHVELKSRLLASGQRLPPRWVVCTWCDVIVQHRTGRRVAPPYAVTHT